MLHYLNNFIKSPQGIILSTLLTFLIAFIINLLEDNIDSKIILIGAIFTIIIILLTMIIYANFSRIEIKEEYSENNDILKAFILAQGLGDLISELEMSRIEANAKEIWVFSLHLSNDIGIESHNKQNNNIFQTVKKNLKKGTRYTYFLPDDPFKYGAIEKFKEIHTFESGQVRFCLIPPKEFHIVSEIVIYDGKQAMQWFPSKAMNYFIKLDEHHLMSILGSGKLLLEQYLQDGIDD